MTTQTSLITTILNVEFPLSATETKPLRDLTEDDCYEVRKHLEATGQQALADAFSALECEVGISGATIVGDVPINRVVDYIGNAPVPRVDA